jgi:hypothetical protein
MYLPHVLALNVPAVLLIASDDADDADACVDREQVRKVQLGTRISEYLEEDAKRVERGEEGRGWARTLPALQMRAAKLWWHFPWLRSWRKG